VPAFDDLGVVRARVESVQGTSYSLLSGLATHAPGVDARDSDRKELAATIERIGCVGDFGEYLTAAEKTKNDERYFLPQSILELLSLLICQLYDYLLMR
jgi:hypothetical protein